MFRIQHSGIIFSFSLLFYDINCYLKIFQFFVILFTILTISSEHCVKSGRIRSYSDLHFPAFGLNTERYRVPRIRSKCGKMTPNTDTFHAVHLITSIEITSTRKVHGVWQCWIDLFPVVLFLKKVLMCFITENDHFSVGCSHN